MELHCPHYEIPIVVDGYRVYQKFKTRQRCWAHVLREAELLAAVRGGSLTKLHHDLQLILHNAKLLPPDISDEVLEMWMDKTARIAKIYQELGHSFGTTLLNAAPELFTFVRYPGMPPTNNKSERMLRRVVLHRKIRLMFRSIAGMKAYSILMTCMMTWDDQNEDMLKKIHQTIMA